MENILHSSNGDALTHWSDFTNPWFDGYTTIMDKIEKENSSFQRVCRLDHIFETGIKLMTSKLKSNSV